DANGEKPIDGLAGASGGGTGPAAGPLLPRGAGRGLGGRFSARRGARMLLRGRPPPGRTARARAGFARRVPPLQRIEPLMNGAHVFSGGHAESLQRATDARFEQLLEAIDGSAGTTRCL